jgi:DNA invertase Pin-like site-specific DNA recombinase
VSTTGQILDRQTRALIDAGCIRVFADKLSGKTAARPELATCLDYLRPGDTLVVPSLDRLSRSLQDLITVVADSRTPRTFNLACARGATAPAQWMSIQLAAE